MYSDEVITGKKKLIVICVITLTVYFGTFTISMSKLSDTFDYCSHYSIVTRAWCTKVPRNVLHSLAII